MPLASSATRWPPRPQRPRRPSSNSSNTIITTRTVRRRLLRLRGISLGSQTGRRTMGSSSRRRVGTLAGGLRGRRRVQSGGWLSIEFSFWFLPSFVCFSCWLFLSVCYSAGLVLDIMRKRDKKKDGEKLDKSDGVESTILHGKRELSGVLSVHEVYSGRPQSREGMHSVCIALHCIPSRHVGVFSCMAIWR